jgi:excisionase family DNA binding protein
MAAVPSLDSNLLTRDQAAKYLGVKPQTLAAWLCRRRYPLPVVRVGRLVRYRLSDLEAFLDARTVGTESADDSER